MTSLSLRAISRFYGDNAVVDRVSIDLAPGEFLSLLGPSGCGKTTTLRMIAGFIEPSEGTIEMNGRVISSPDATMPPEAREMSMIFQSYAVWPHMTVAENIAFGLKLRKLARHEIEQRVNSVLDLVRMSHVAHRYPSELSGGQQQRVALARAIVIRPKVLLLDEPLSNLDAALREEMRREIRRLHEELALTTVYVTHDQAEAMAASDRIAVMSNGRVEQIADPQTIYSRPATEFVASFVGRTNLLPGRVDGREIAIDNLSLRLPFPADESSPWSGTVKVSLRPQDIALLETQPSTAGALPARVCERVFTGDAWQYVLVVEPEQTPLSVTAPTRSSFSVGDQVWVAPDLAQAVVLKA